MQVNLAITVLLYKEVSEMPSIYNDRRIFKYIQCGGSFGKNKNFDNLILDDAFQDNISDLNKFLNDHTGIYFIGKHIDELFPNIDYIGNMQYSKGFFVDFSKLNKRSIFLPMLIDGRKNVDKFSNYMYWKELYPVYCRRLIEMNSFYSDIEEYGNSSVSSHFNMFLVPIDVFKKWFAIYIDGIETCKQMIKENSHNNFSRSKTFDDFRIYAYLQEFFASYAFYKITNRWNRNDYDIYACRFFGFDSLKSKTRKM